MKHKALFDHEAFHQFFDTSNAAEALLEKTRFVPRISPSVEKSESEFEGITKRVDEPKANVTMFLVSPGNDIRAKKEADMLTDAGYEVTFIGRDPAVDRVVERVDDGYPIFVVPTISNAASIRRLLKNDKKFFTLKERVIAYVIAAIFNFCNFSITFSSTGMGARIDYKDFKFHNRVANLIARKQVRLRGVSIRKRSFAGMFLSWLLSLASKIVEKPYLILGIIFFPVLIIYLICKAMASVQSKMAKRADSYWGSIFRSTKVQSSIGPFFKISVLRVLMVVNFLIFVGPLKLVQFIGRIISSPFTYVRDRARRYLSARARLIYTLASYFFYSLETRATAVKLKGDVHHAHDLYMLQAAYRSAEHVNAKVIYDAHELETERHSGVHPKMKEKIYKQEALFGANADGLITVSDSIAQVMNKNMNRNDTVVIFNSPIIPEKFVVKANIRKDLNLSPTTPLALYVGKLSSIHIHDQRIENMIEAIAYVPNMHLALLGAISRSAHNEISSWANRYFVSDRVFVVDPVPYEHLVPYITTADIGINPLQKKVVSNEYSMPNKLFELALAGVPMVQANTKDSMDFLNKYNIGLAMDAMKPLDIARAIMETYADRSTLSPTGAVLDELRSEFSIHGQGRKLTELYERILAR